MASTIYTGTASQTTAYAATDIYTLAIPTSSITNVAQQGSNVVISTGATALTITGVTLAQLANANFAIQGGGAIQFGDGTSSTVADQFGDNINFSANNNGTVVLGLGGADTIQAGNGANLIYGGAGVTDPTDGGDQITTGTGNDTIYGNGGNDLIASGGGTDIVFGGIGNDTITTGALTGNVSVYGGGSFTDTVDGADLITVASNAGNLFLTGNAGNDTIVLTASTGSASIYGGIGADTITASASAGNNLIAGGSSTGSTDVDTIVFNASGTANVTVFGGVGITDTVDGADSITVNGLAAGSTAFVYGNAGNDTISVGTAGTASIYGGVGTDSITLQAGAASGRVQVFAGAADGTGADTVDGSLFQGNATIYGGNGLNDSVDGADRLVGGFGNDVIYGNGGNDTILSGNGNDQLSGGVGNDLFAINGTGNKAIVDFGTGSDSVVLGSNLGAVNSVGVAGSTLTITTASGNVAVSGTLPSTFTASFDANNDGVVAGTDGSLVVATTSTGTSLIGTANADVIYGNSGADTIVGAAGADTITGGTGADVITGGAGADVFRFGNSDSGLTVATADTITDFVAADDSLALGFVGNVAAPATANYSEAGAAVADFTAALTAANTALASLAAGNTGTLEAANFQFTGAGATLVGYLFNDTDGNGTADQVIVLTGIDNTGISEANLVA